MYECSYIIKKSRNFTYFWSRFNVWCQNRSKYKIQAVLRDMGKIVGLQVVALKVNLEGHLKNILPLHRSRPGKQYGASQEVALKMNLEGNLKNILLYTGQDLVNNMGPVNSKIQALATCRITYHILSGSAFFSSFFFQRDDCQASTSCLKICASAFRIFAEVYVI